MMTSDGNCKFKQVKFGKTWRCMILLSPLGDWYNVEATAAVLGLSIVGSAWTVHCQDSRRIYYCQRRLYD